MKKLILGLIALSLATQFTSCKKATTTTTTTTPTTTTSFTWTENGGSTITADSAKWTTGAWGTGIRAWKATGTYFFEINWDTQDNTSVGSKALTTPYGLTMLKSGSSGFIITTASTLNITAFSNDKMSGNFSVPASDGTTTLTISGTFSNIPKY